MVSNPAARVFKGDLSRWAKRINSPYVGTTYRLTEHFHYWTKQRCLTPSRSRNNSWRSEKLANKLGIAHGDTVKVSSTAAISKPGGGDKRIRTLKADGKDIDTIGIPIHWGYEGVAKKGFIANTLTPFVGDANTQTPEFKAFLVNVERRNGDELWLINRKTLSVVPRLTASPAPCARDHQEEVAKLIDVTTCIGCKACQVACSEWNDIRDEVGHNVGVYDNPADLTAKSLTVIAFSEVEQNDKLEWLIRRMAVCTVPTRLPEGLPGGRGDHSVRHGIVDFQSEQCIGCGYCIAGCPFNVPRLNRKTTASTNARCASTALTLARSRRA